VKVLHFYRTYFPDSQGGLEETIRQICASTKQHEVESRVLTLSEKPLPSVLSLPEADVYRARLDVDIFSCGMGVQAFAMFRALEEWADIIHFHFPWPFADLVQLLTQSKKPAIITYHSDIVRQRSLAKLYFPLMSRFLSNAKRIVATSPSYADTSLILKRYAEKIDVIPIGLDEHSYPMADNESSNRIQRICAENFYLFIGVLREYKGLSFLLEAVRGAPYSLVIAGNGPQEIALKSQAAKLGLSNVIFLGYISDELKVGLIERCRALVLPSHLRSEAFGVSLLEGAMKGRPLISTEIGTGTSYVNIDGETGIVCESGNAAALRNAMDRIDSSRDYACKLGAGARKRFDQLFTSDIMGEKYAKVYKSIVYKI